METNHIGSESQEKYSSCNSPPKSATNGDLHTDVYLNEFFPELKAPEVHRLPKDLNKMQQVETMMNGHGSLIDDLFIQNEKLKVMNKELKEKSLLKESQIAKYEADLSEKLQDILKMNQELETWKEKYQVLNKIKDELDEELTQLRVNLNQLLETREKNMEANQIIQELRKDLSSKEKAHRKLKTELETASQKIVERNSHGRKMKSANKKLWHLIIELGETLSKNGLLTVKKKEQFLKELDDQISTSELGSEGENIKVSLCGLNTNTVSQTVESSNGSHSVNRIPNKDSSDPVSSPGSSTERQQSHSKAIVNISTENCVTSNMRSYAENCVTSNIRSYGSNYFMKTHKDVIEDLVSEDYNELNSFRQQLSVRNEPISPLPPTPPPKNAKLLKSEPAKSSVFAGKKLNFFHQQSESFEVQNVEQPVEKPPLLSSACATPTLPNPSPYTTSSPNPSSCTISSPNPTQYTISSKLNHDGSLKLDFSANYDTHLSFDMNTRKVSCTVMPSAQFQTDCLSVRDSPPRASSHPISSTTPQMAESLSHQLSLNSNCMEAATNCAAGIKKIGTDLVNNESLRNPKKIKLDKDCSLSKKIQKPVNSVCITSPKQNEIGSLSLQQNSFSQEGGVPFSRNNLSHEKKTLNDIGRSGKIYSAFVSPTEKHVTIPSVRVSPRQLKVISSNVACEERPMEIDNLQSSAAIHDKITANDDKSPNKRKKRPRKIKNANNSEDLIQLSPAKDKSKTKNRKVMKKRKISDLESKNNNDVFDEKNKCSDSNNEDESKNVQHNEMQTLKDESSTRLITDIELQKDSFPSSIQKELNVSPLEGETSDLFKVPCAINEAAKEITSSVSNVVEKLPNDDELCEVANLLTGQIDNNLNNDIDFSDIQVSPFNPSTFVSRGLFDNELLRLEDSQKLNCSETKNDSVSQQVDALQAGGELVPSCLESPLKDSMNNGYNNNVIIDNDGVAETPSGAQNSDSVPNTVPNGHIVSNSINVNDGLDSDHSLVIAEDVEQNVTVSDSTENSPNKTEAIRRKKPINKKPPRVKKCPRKKKESPEIVDTHTIAAAFRSLDEMKFTDMHFKQNQHTLVNALINPNNAAGSKDAVYQVLRYVVSSRANPLLNYFMSEDENALMPLSEKCLVQALVQISRKKKLRLQGLLLSVVDTAYELIITKESFQIYGLSSLCRILTEICRCLNDKNRPLMLCSELLKQQHKFAPYLIASVAGVWKELFSVDCVSDEERIFHSSIVYGTQRKPASLNEQQWKHCSKVLSLFLSAQFPYQINEMVTFLVQTIETKCVTGSLENEYILTTPLVVFTAVEGWNWSKEILVDEHIIPLLVKFSEQEMNEKAFAVFCLLYADICYFCPSEEDPHEVFGEFFNNESDEGNEFVRNAAAMSQIKLLLHKKQLLPDYLTEWISQIQHKTDYVEYAERLFQRRLMNDNPEFLDSDVL